MNVTEIGREIVHCIRLTQDGTSSVPLWTTEWSFVLHEMRECGWLAERILASQIGLCFMELAIPVINWTCFYA